MKKTILAVLAMGTLSCALFSQQAQAAQVQGEIHMTGDIVFDSVDLSSSTAVNHWISVQNTPEKATTFGATGDFTAIPPLTEADMTHPWTFSPSTPTSPLWSVPAILGFRFNLAIVLSVTHVGNNFVNVLAAGVVQATGFDDTPALFSFTANNPDGQTHATYGFADATIAIPTPGGCVLTQGFWKNHPEAWPVTQLQLGSVNYDQQELLDILHQPVSGNGLVSLAHQLIAAKLNIAAGADPSCIQETIAEADALIGDLVVPPVGDGFLAPRDVSALVETLTDYNEGSLCAPSCDQSPPPTATPVAITNPATLIASFSTIINGSVDPNGLATTAYFQYGTTTGYGFTTAPHTKTGNTPQSVSANISRLTASTTYHFRLVTTNSAGTRYGSDRTFTTLPPTGFPMVTTKPAANVATFAATLNGLLDPHGLTTTVHLQYGTTTSYGHTTRMQSQTGNAFRNINADINGLRTRTTYHFRIVATNSAGTRYGSDRTFTTQ